VSQDYRKRAEEFLTQQVKMMMALGAYTYVEDVPKLEKLLADIAHEARQEENEACARVCDGSKIKIEDNEVFTENPYEIAKAIRARIRKK